MVAYLGRIEFRHRFVVLYEALPAVALLSIGLIFHLPVDLRTVGEEGKER